MNDPIVELTVKDLLADENSYIIPMYQRNYAWSEGEISQLVQDIVDYQKKQQEKYYIGTLVVFNRKDGGLEVIDGQQRFTTLSLMATYLKNLQLSESNNKFKMDWFKRLNIKFDSRPKSTATFDALSYGVKSHNLNNEKYNDSIVDGYSIVEKTLSKLKEISLEEFIEYMLNHVHIMRVAVPKETDLNHYFEAMNNRGEQLEKHEVLKAKMMSVLNNIEGESKKTAMNALHRVWEGCANMDRYIQYAFSPSERDCLYLKNDWGSFPLTNFDELAEQLDTSNDENKALSLSKIISKPPATSKVRSSDKEDLPERFNSVINFSNFLLHVLKVFTQKDVSLDDKQLIDQFEKYLLNSSEPIEKVKEFTFALLEMRFLFDQCVIKREYSQGKDEWSLKRLKWYSKKSVSYINRFDADKNEDGYEGLNRQLLMLQSAFHVSTPTQVYKHWLSAVLYFLYYESTEGEIDAKLFLNYLNNLAKRFVFERFLDVDNGKSYFEMIFGEDDNHSLKNVKINSELLRFGEIENNFVFNYLDYLLWQEHKEKDAVIKEFEFTFRSSVEHFYPQHPMEGHPDLEADYLHSFGNLCLISHSKNSRLSNLPPGAKVAHFKASIDNKAIDSLKLYMMIEVFNNQGAWGQKQITAHGKDMVNLLLNSTKTGSN